MCGQVERRRNMADKELPERPITRVQLTGCTPEPLMGYLKAIGVFRLVAEQADPQARLAWEGGIPWLTSHLTRQELIDFFVARYQPTPIVAPWNGGSGFYSGGREPLELLEHSNNDRLHVYRETLQRIRQFLPESKPKEDAKEALLEQCRARLPDEVVPWLDACFVLGDSGAIYFPLLGTGGNDGRLDFTNNFLQRITEILPANSGDPAPASTERLLEAALFADVLVSLGRTSIGQFSPGGIGGPNGTQGRFEADSRVNPWDFVLLIEGTLLFAGSAARRLGQRTSLRAVFPFSVDSIAVGYGSAVASEETSEGSRAETWLPLWQEPATLAEKAPLVCRRTRPM
ncbi:MAG: type I-U CRISPR-associated protein Csx17 [Pirellulales bacterium]